MSGIVAGIRKFKYKLKHDYLSVENVVLFVAIIMCITWTYQSIEAMSRNWELTERLNSERRNLDLISVEVEAAELENEYYKTDEYQELAARKYANKQLPGEHMVYMAQNSEAALNKHKTSEASEQSEVVEEVEKSNFEKWVQYLLP